MPSPSAVLGFILATLYGALFHLLTGGGPRRLASLIVAGWLGFALGHALGMLAGIDAGKVGPLRLLTATVGAWAAMGVTHWLMVSEVRRPAG